MAPNPFLALDRETRQEIYLATSGMTGLTGPILEKDVWVCWTLRGLFSMHGDLPMAFKGGTSLSKVTQELHYEVVAPVLRLLSGRKRLGTR